MKKTQCAIKKRFQETLFKKSAGINTDPDRRLDPTIYVFISGCRYIREERAEVCVALSLLLVPTVSCPDHETNLVTKYHNPLL